MNTRSPLESPHALDTPVSPIAGFSTLRLGLDFLSDNFGRIGEKARKAGALIGVVALGSAVFAGSAIASGKKHAEGTRGAKVELIKNHESQGEQPTITKHMNTVYAYGSDHAPQSQNGAEVQEVESDIQDWFSRQSGGAQFNFGSDKPVNLKLNKSEADLGSLNTATSNSQFMLDVTNELHNAGYNDPNTLYLVGYEGQTPYFCGAGFYNGGPNQPYSFNLGNNNTAMVFFEPNCSTTKGNGIDHQGYTALRAILSTLGLPSDSAKNTIPGGGALTTPYNDLMYFVSGGEVPTYPWWGAQLDPTHENYFQLKQDSTAYNQKDPLSNPDLALSPYISWPETVSTTGGGSVEVNLHYNTGNPDQQISVNNGTSWRVPGGTVETITKNSDAKWAGDCAGQTGNTCTLVMDRPHNISVIGNKPNSESIKITVNGKGTVKAETIDKNLEGVAGAAGGIVCKKVCTFKELDGTSVLFIETPAKGYKFAGWLENGKLVTNKNHKPVLGNLTVKNLRHKENVIAKFVPTKKK